MANATTVTINGKEYPLPKINYHAVVALEELGFDARKVTQNLFKTYTALVAYVTGTDFDEAVDLMEQHFAAGGTINDFVPILQHVSDSGFFQKMLLGAETAQNPTEEQK